MPEATRKTWFGRLSEFLCVSLPQRLVCARSYRGSQVLSLQPELKIELMMSDRYEDLVAEGSDLALPIGSQPNSHS